MSELYTPRLGLRMIGPQDAEDFFEYASQPEVGPNAGWKPHADIEETRAIMREIFMDKETVWGMVLRESGKMIGSIGLIEDPKRDNDGVRMLGYALGRDYWGRGLMSEAAQEAVRYGFQDLGLELISAYCYPANQRSRGVLRKCGFSYEGTLKRAEKAYDGTVYDNECWAVMR